MSNWFRKYIKHIDYFIMLFIFVIYFALPVLFTRIDGEISWLHVIKIWQDQFLLIPVFIINHWLLVPKILLRRRYIFYLISVAVMIAICTFSYYYRDNVINEKPPKQYEIENKRPSPIPPYANLLMHSLLIVGVDTGLLYSKKWRENEEKKHILEKKNAEMQLEILRNQVSPHFFMNTLNNIHALIDYNQETAKNSVVKLSKLMRVLLYENENYTLQKEIEFINDYIELMKIRVNPTVEIKFEYPEIIPHIHLPALLFINFVENAFKHGIKAVGKSFIHIYFNIEHYFLNVSVKNSKIINIQNNTINQKIGMENARKRLDLLYANNYNFNVIETETTYEIYIKIPIYENQMPRS